MTHGLMDGWMVFETLGSLLENKQYYEDQGAHRTGNVVHHTGRTHRVNKKSIAGLPAPLRWQDAVYPD